MPSRFARNCSRSCARFVRARRPLSPAKRRWRASKSRRAALTLARPQLHPHNEKARAQSLADRRGRVIPDVLMNLRTDPPSIPFIDVAAQRRRLGSAVDAAVARVLSHCQFILGPEVRAFEAELAAFCDAKQVITCASGTDALV